MVARRRGGGRAATTASRRRRRPASASARAGACAARAWLSTRWSRPSILCGRAEGGGGRGRNSRVSKNGFRQRRNVESSNGRSRGRRRVGSIGDDRSAGRTHRLLPDASLPCDDDGAPRALVALAPRRRCFVGESESERSRQRRAGGRGARLIRRKKLEEKKGPRRRRRRARDDRSRSPSGATTHRARARGGVRRFPPARVHRRRRRRRERVSPQELAEVVRLVARHDDRRRPRLFFRSRASEPLDLRELDSTARSLLRGARCLSSARSTGSRARAGGGVRVPLRARTSDAGGCGPCASSEVTRPRAGLRRLCRKTGGQFYGVETNVFHSSPGFNI